MEAAVIATADAPITDHLIDDPLQVADGSDRDERSRSELSRLMDIAHLYARRLVATADAPPGALLFAQHGDLDVLLLDGPDPDVLSLPLVVAQRAPSSVAVVVVAEGALAGTGGDVVFVVGETRDGIRDERRFRMRACGRTRRLTRLPEDGLIVSAGVVPRLFPSHDAPTA